MKVRLISSIAIACCVAYPWQWVAGEEEIKYPSPDGKFALRITDSSEGGVKNVALIQKASGEVMVDLGISLHSRVLVWSPDSKWAAYGDRGYGAGELKVCFWNGSRFEKMALPEELPSPDIKFPKKIRSLKNYGGSATPLQWLKSGELELSSDSRMLDRISGATYTGDLRFTLAFDAQHHASVKEVGETKTEVTNLQEKPPARSVSPDGKWEFRSGAAGEEDDFVIAKAGSIEASLVLSEEEYTDGLAEYLGRKPDYANIVWAPDSRRFAFNLQPGKGFQTAQIYQLDGQAWRKLDPPESRAAMTAPLARSMTNKKKRVKEKLKLSADDWGWPLMTSWRVRKWVDSSTVLLYAYQSAKFEIEKGTEEVNIAFFFTLKFDHVGNWKITRNFEVPEKGVGGLNAEEHKEINKIENDDRELRSK
jgi:hypothetical protein